MKRFLLASALALGAMTTVALAESVTPAENQAGPAQLTSAQLDKVTAGVYGGGTTISSGKYSGSSAGGGVNIVSSSDSHRVYFAGAGGHGPVPGSGGGT
jgi:hypothetical protein